MGLIRAADVVPQAVDWLWPGYLPKGKVVMLDGDPGLGKSTLLCDLAARLSRGEPLPNGKRHDPMGVLLLMGEDGAADTTVPRLAAAGADLHRIGLRDTYINEKGLEIPPMFPEDLHHLQYDIEALEAGLVVIDPVFSYLSDQINANSDQQVRRAMMPLKDLAEETGATIVLVRHLNKSSGGSALYRGGGSIGFVGVSRVALLMARHPEDEERRILAVNKTNLGALPPSLAFRLADCNGAARIAWEGVTNHTAEDIMERPADQDVRSAVAEAIEFLQDILKPGATFARDVQKAARDAGIAWDTVRRAQRSLGIRPQKAKTQDGQWTWALPPAMKAEDVEDEGSHHTFNTFNNNNNFNTFKQLRQDVEDVEDVEDVDARRVHTFETPNGIPVAAASGEGYECVHCGTPIKYVVRGAPLLCPKHRVTLAQGPAAD